MQALVEGLAEVIQRVRELAASDKDGDGHDDREDHAADDGNSWWARADLRLSSSHGDGLLFPRQTASHDAVPP